MLRFTLGALVAGALPGCLIHSADAPSAAAPADESVMEVGAGEDDGEGLTAALASSLPDGSLVKSTRTAVVDPSAQRIAVRFESAWAEQAFERSLAARRRRGDAVRGHSTSGLPLVWTSEERSVLSENAFYNEQARRADVDGNGLVDDDEARRYSAATARVATR
jgi:hypothetical protein